MQKSITIYTTQTCVYCRMAKEYFKKNNLEYKEYDVSSDLEKQKEMLEKSQQLGVPVIDIGGDIIIGFDKPKIEHLLDLHS